MKETPQQKYQRLVNEIQELVQEVDTIQVSETLKREIVASVLRVTRQTDTSFILCSVATHAHAVITLINPICILQVSKFEMRCGWSPHQINVSDLFIVI